MLLIGNKCHLVLQEVFTKGISVSRPLAPDPGSDGRSRLQFVFTGPGHQFAFTGSDSN